MPPVWTHSALWFRWRFVSPFLSSHHRMLWCLLLWFRCCLGICLFLSLLIAVRNSSVVISWILIISFWCCCYAHRCCSHFHSHRFLVQFILVHCRRFPFCRAPQRHGQSLFETWWFHHLILYLGDEHSSFCRFDSWDVLCTFEVFKYSLDVLLSFHSFFVSDIF